MTSRYYSVRVSDEWVDMYNPRDSIKCSYTIEW